MKIKTSIFLLSLVEIGFCQFNTPEPVSEIELPKLAGRWYNVSLMLTTKC